MISSVTPSVANNESNTAFGDLGTELFLKLLVAQLQNQNPMEPMDGAALLQQTSQLANVEALNELSDLQAHIVGLGQFGAAAGMIGQTVTASDPIFGDIEGVVTGVRATATGPMLQIGGFEFSFDQVMGVAVQGQAQAAIRQPATTSTSTPAVEAATQTPVDDTSEGEA